jgi:uncharacterized protein YutE (UPF0331/DUF86 family)
MSPEGRRLTEDRVTGLLGYCDELATALAETKESPLRRRAVERLVQLIVECVADIGFDLAETLSLGSPGSTREAIETARRAGLFPEEAAEHFERRYVSLRNRIVHDYERLDALLILNEANRLTEDARLIAAALMKRMKDEE